MARIAGAAPLPELCADMCALVEGVQFQKLVRTSDSLTKKILEAIPKAHKSSIHVEMLKLNSGEDAELNTMRSNINFPAIPDLNWERDPLESRLINAYEYLQQERALLNVASSRLGNATGVADLTNDVRDLAFKISKMLKKLQTDYVVHLDPTPVSLVLNGDYDVQVAVHLTLVQLQSLSQDIQRFLRNLDMEEDSYSRV
ncbi:uncharacterized protein LOC144092882 [Stigmatopora argus]